MAATRPPLDFDGLIRRIHEQHARFSRTNKALSRFLTQYPNEVAVKSVNEIARRCEVHPSTLVRFAQGLGFSGFRDFQAVFRNRLMTEAPGFEARAARLRTELTGSGAKGYRRHLRDLVIRDISALEELLETVEEAALARAADLLAKAETIYLIGQKRSEPVVAQLRYGLMIAGCKTVALDTGGGLALEAARLMAPSDALIAVSFEPYTAETLEIAETAVARAVPVLALADSTLGPVAGLAQVLFTVPEHQVAQSPSIGAAINLAQVLVLGVHERRAQAAASKTRVHSDIAAPGTGGTPS